MNNKKQTIGFWDKGKGTTLLGCSSDGFDIGLKADGKNLLAKSFQSTNNGQNSVWYEKWWMKYIVLPVVVAIFSAVALFFFGFK